MAAHRNGKLTYWHKITRKLTRGFFILGTLGTSDLNAVHCHSDRQATHSHELVALQCAGRYAAEDRHHLRETLASPDRARLPLDQSDTDAEQDLTSLEEQAVPDPQHRLP